MKRRDAILAALVSGILLCFSFPTMFFGWHAPELGWLGFVALVPLFVAIRKRSPRNVFLLTALTGLVGYSSSLYWLFRALHTYGHLPSVTSVLVLALLMVILSAYMGLAPMLARILELRWRGQWLALVPVCWTAVELSRNFVPCNGFPWGNIAMSQWRFLPMIQIADLTGIYGITFVVVWINAFLAEVVARLRGEEVLLFRSKIVVTGIVLLLTLGYGAYRLTTATSLAEMKTEVLRIGVVQGNIPQEIKWEQSRAVENVNVMRAGTHRLQQAAVDLILWPESAFPWPIPSEATSIDPRALGFDAQAFGPEPRLLLGAISDNPDGSYYNSALLFSAQGNVEGRYHKAHLVPFGEYVPYRKLLFFARKLTEPAGNFLEGKGYEPLRAGEASLGPLICYEDVFPEVARRLTAHGAEVLVNLTNDAWYGVSSAPFQHLAIAVFRAVENRRYLVRATNTGVSAIIAPTGRVEMESGIFEETLLVAPVGLFSEQSVYTRLGDWFPLTCAAYVVVGIGVIVVRRIRRHQVS